MNYIYVYKRGKLYGLKRSSRTRLEAGAHSSALLSWSKGGTRGERRGRAKRSSRGESCNKSHAHDNSVVRVDTVAIPAIPGVLRIPETTEAITIDVRHRSRCVRDRYLNFESEFGEAIRLISARRIAKAIPKLFVEN